MTAMTKRDAVDAAMSVAEDVAEGRLSPSALQAQALTELRQLFGTVIGPDDPAWPLQCDIARQVLAMDGVPATELAEWLAVARHRAGEPVSEPEPEHLADDLAEPDAELADTKLAAPELEVEPPPARREPTPVPPARRNQYDPLAHWPPARTLRR